MRRLRRDIQIVFQDPYTSLNPRKTVGDIVGEPFEIHPDVVPKGGRRKAGCRSCSTWSASTPSTSTATRTSSPAASGSASASPAASRSTPRCSICDEPVSALDVSVQAQVVNLMEKLQDELGPGLHLHRPRPVRGPAHLRPGRRDVPRQDGRAGRRGPDLRPADPPLHPGAAVGRAGARPDAARQARADRAQRRRAVSPANPPSGCRFHTRCWKAQDKCKTDIPLLEHAPRRRRRAPVGLPLRRRPARSSRRSTSPGRRRCSPRRSVTRRRSTPLPRTAAPSRPAASGTVTTSSTSATAPGVLSPATSPSTAHPRRPPLGRRRGRQESRPP